ncbi:MAG: ABC transporter permease [Deltaproteobacteria bacterium]
MLALAAVALFGPRLAPHESVYFVLEHGADPRPYEPGVVFPFGSDVLGRDMLSLVLAGAGATLRIALVAGAARVLAGVALATIGRRSRPLRLATESIADLVSAVPATLAALVIVKVLVKADTSIFIFISALLVLGWVGPYRVIRAEVDRLAHAPFVIGAKALGMTPTRLFWRHQLPHLVPVLAINLAQQIVASLVLVAELGVLGTFVGTTRTISVEESLQRVVTGIVNTAQIADPPEWGGLLAGSRTVESLWTTRWVIFVPGAAFALTALAVAIIGFGISRRYARADLVGDLRSPFSGVLALALTFMVVASAFVPERYSSAREWADAARAHVTTPPSTDTQAAFAAARHWEAACASPSRACRSSNTCSCGVGSDSSRLRPSAFTTRRRSS